MRSNVNFLLAAFVVAAALWKAGVPPLPILAGVVLVYLWNRRGAHTQRSPPHVN